MRADGDEHRVEAALVPLGREVGDPMIAASHACPSPRLGSVQRRARRGGVGSSGCRTASCRRESSPHHGASTWWPARQADTRRTVRSVRRRRSGRACQSERAVARTSSRAPWRGRRGIARPSGSIPRCRDELGCRRFHRGDSTPGRGWRRTGCPRPAAATRPRGGLPWHAPARAWMFSPAGQPALHGGSRST